MELDELKQRLGPFCRHHYRTDNLTIENVFNMPGHAGFAYGFSVRVGNDSKRIPSRQTSDNPLAVANDRTFEGALEGAREVTLEGALEGTFENTFESTFESTIRKTNLYTDKWFLRLPPPNVKWQGTADVLRQVAVLDILPKDIPHCPVQWSGSDEQWFGRPYFVVPQLNGDVVRPEEDEWVAALDGDTRVDMAKQAMIALARIHRVDAGRAPYLGKAIGFLEDVERWDRFIEKAADPQRLALASEVKKLLLQQLPQQAPTGIFHGDFQWSNLFYSRQGKLLAVIDWELVGVGAILNDLGWIATFNDAPAWSSEHRTPSLMPAADELIAMYVEASGEAILDTNWYRALAAYKFAIISGFNLMLHRRGKRHDPMWETGKLSIEPLLARARQLLLENRC